MFFKNIKTRRINSPDIYVGGTKPNTKIVALAKIIGTEVLKLGETIRPRPKGRG